MDWYCNWTKKHLGVKFDGTIFDIIKYMMPVVVVIFTVYYFLFKTIL